MTRKTPVGSGGISLAAADTTRKTRASIAVVSFALVAGCSGQARDDVVRETSSRVVYGKDDRREVYLGNSWEKRVAETELLAIAYKSDAETAQVAGWSAIQTSGERHGLCPGEPFADEPALAFCTALVVSAGVAVTAAHCLSAGPLNTLVAIDGFYYDAPNRLEPLTPSNIHNLTEVIRKDEEDDYAWVRFDRPATGPNLAIDELPMNSTSPVVAINHGAGLPGKIDDGAVAVRVSGSMVIATTDSFAGASGGPVFSTTGAVVGIVTAGTPDYVRSDSECFVSSHAPDNAEDANELLLSIGVAIAGLCQVEPNNPSCHSQVSGDAVQTGSCAVGPLGRERGTTGGLVATLLLGLAGRARIRRRTRRLRGSGARCSQCQA